MSSDSEIDDLQRFEEARERELSNKAGLGRNQFRPDDDDMSEEEVLGLGSDSNYTSEEEDQDQDGYYEQDDEAVKRRRDRTNREQDENWGNTRDNYFGGEDDIGEDEGASEEEEAEALRLQQKELEEMAESDFVDEDNLDGWKKEADTLDLESVQASQAIDPSTMSAEERRELVEEKFPAVILLTGELSKIQDWEKELAANDSESPEVLDIGKTALNTYKGMIYSFFALFTDRLQKGDMSGLSRLDEHPVNEGLLMARQLWLNYCNTNWKSAAAKEDELPSAVDVNVAEDENESSSEVENEDDNKIGGDEMYDETDLSEYSDRSDDGEEEDEFSIAKPPSHSTSRKKNSGVVGDFDEAADTIEQQARAKNKQSLRFYTSQIGKGDIKRQDAYSGDVDLPYRERDFERRQRLMAEAQKRGQQQKDVLGDDDLEEFNQDSDNFSESGSGSVYSQIKRKRDMAKQDKQKRHSEAVEAARAGQIAEYLADNPNVDKRAINYQIEKNKGLTRKRKKENRNARVKKRVRYEAAQKKLKGVRQVYKGAEGPYQGELTGIRKNLTHSTRFKN